ncbi:MAG TPA: hypothetical protein VL921_09520 [Candidatus Udaeobacter sp.]|nr:hypothetical protein [Candidatus Udaeobacter sp.]
MIKDERSESRNNAKEVVHAGAFGLYKSGWLLRNAQIMLVPLICTNQVCSFNLVAFRQLK